VLSKTGASFDEADDEVDSAVELTSAAEEEPASVDVPLIDDDELLSFFITAASVPELPDQHEKEEASIDTFNDIFIDSSDMYVQSSHN